jgi:small subunit ribosomal protein S6e
MKIVYSDQKTGKSGQMQLDSEKSGMLMNHKINDVIDGGILGLEGYKLKITGGSDTSGFPMNRSITGPIKTKVLRMVAKSGRRKGQHERSTVRGNTITNDTELVNTIIVEYGSKPAAELFPENPEKKKAREEKKAAAQKKK